jgi:hypothetical protein
MARDLSPADCAFRGAVRLPDEQAGGLVVNGAKIWTSPAQEANKRAAAPGGPAWQPSAAGRSATARAMIGAHSDSRNRRASGTTALRPAPHLNV